ncbi:LAGLIDADG family homing endonuclease [Nocardiopsis sp. FR26]|uniref:LAGLIDADG family homing endonuclease n=1 Tax=Nocardiopsis sp. FR26 TaxID=2605987 RepID=UPI001F2B28FF|nr:LAGLIDADG family homing endonuclease [Nocardiopsis sp. FR26]
MSKGSPHRSVGGITCVGCTEVYSDWKHWPCLFPQHGPGRKHDRAIVLEPWQGAIVEGHPEAFIRGLIHSDGCRVENRVRRQVGGEWKYYLYPRYEFVSVSEDIIGLLTGALDHLGIPWKRQIRRQAPGRGRDRIVVSVARRGAVARMDAFVGPKY